jgi:hypothetical protein
MSAKKSKAPRRRRQAWSGPQAADIDSYRVRTWWINRVLAVKHEFLSPAAKNVLVRLAHHHNIETLGLWVGAANLGKETGYGERQVHRLILEAEAAGWLQKLPSKGGRGLSNSYLLLDLNHDTYVRVCALNHDKIPPKPCHSESDQKGLTVSSMFVGGRKTPTRADLRDFAATLAAPYDGFEEFWDIFPLKAGKDGAKREWKIAVTTRGISKEEILAGARRYRDEREGENPKFTMHPAKWLRDGHYSDEPRPPPSQEVRSKHNGTKRYANRKPSPVQVAGAIYERSKAQEDEEANHGS